MSMPAWVFGQASKFVVNLVITGLYLNWPASITYELGNKHPSNNAKNIHASLEAVNSL